MVSEGRRAVLKWHVTHPVPAVSTVEQFWRLVEELLNSEDRPWGQRAREGDRWKEEGSDVAALHSSERH